MRNNAGVFMEILSVTAWLWRMPLCTLRQLQAAVVMPENRLHRRLVSLERDGLAGRCSLRGAGRRQQRWCLWAAGVEKVVQGGGDLTVRWQVVQEGIASLVTRMPVVEYLYDLALALGGHRIVVKDRPAREAFIDVVTAIGLRYKLNLRDFKWCEGGDVDALIFFSNGGWFCVLWVGPSQTWHDLRIRLERVRRVPGATLDAKTGAPLDPAGWVFLCHDPLGAAHVAGLWPGDDALIVTVDGHVEREMRPHAFSSYDPYPTKPWDLGRPELATQWLKRDTPLWALEHEQVHDAFRFITEHRGATVTQVERQIGPRYAGALLELEKRAHTFVKEFEGSLYPTLKSCEAASVLDGADRGKVLERGGAVLGHHGCYRRAQQAHDRAQIDVLHKLRSEGIDSFGGYRNLWDLDGITQLRPDLVACLPRTNGGMLPVNVEIEFSATSPSSSESRPHNYEKASMILGEPVPSLWVLPNERVRRLYQSALDWLIAFTTTLPELMAGTSWGCNSVWRDRDGCRVPITNIVDIVEVDLSED